MNQIEAKSLTDLMTQLWPNWAPTEAELRLWNFEFCKYSESPARKALQEASFRSNFKTPPRKTIRELLQVHEPIRRSRAMADEPSIFAMYHGGGEGTLLAGYYYPVRCHDGPVMDAAQRDIRLREESIGGQWRVYEQTTNSKMRALRKELRDSMKMKGCECGDGKNVLRH